MRIECSQCILRVKKRFTMLLLSMRRLEASHSSRDPRHRARCKTNKEYASFSVPQGHPDITPTSKPLTLAYKHIS
ncbi:hypothetical protein EYC80_007523 [Monilinia laxa]|uniref:Uncharacterized protein n=1 Tax=Monilinia laxa TaxID=61186 RepID=A0A5N6JW70_MONLA|nr:hypothetical protein EYC80_007523 [Monilinia laxa]